MAIRTGSPSKKANIINVMDVETRTKRRKSLSDPQIDSLVTASPETRQKYLIDQIADNHELWVVFDGQELPTFESSQNDVVHVWPNREFASLFRSKTIANPEVVPIPIDDWIDDVLYAPNLEPVDIAYFPVGLGKPVVMSDQDEFLRLVSSEWIRRFGNHADFDQRDPIGSIQNLLKQGFKNSMKSKPKGRLP